MSQIDYASLSHQELKQYFLRRRCTIDTGEIQILMELFIEVLSLGLRRSFTYSG